MIASLFLLQEMAGDGPIIEQRLVPDNRVIKCWRRFGNTSGARTLPLPE